MTPRSVQLDGAQRVAFGVRCVPPKGGNAPERERSPDPCREWEKWGPASFEVDRASSPTFAGLKSVGSDPRTLRASRPDAHRLRENDRPEIDRFNGDLLQRLPTPRKQAGGRWSDRGEASGPPPDTAPGMEPLLTCSEVGALLRLHPKTVERMAREGRVPCLRVAGRVRFDRPGILRYLAERRAE